MSHSMYKISGTEATLISSECNPETSKGSENSSDLYILNGTLYYNGSQVGTETTWTDLGELDSISFGISNGELYFFSVADTPFPEKIEGTIDWVSVTGKINYPSFQGYTCYAYALRSDGQIYSLSYKYATETVNAVRVTISGQTIDGFTCVKGTSILREGMAACCLAIADGKLYAVCGSYANQIGSGTGWTSISDLDSSEGFGICDGKLYLIIATGNPDGAATGVDTNPNGTAAQIGSRTGWSKISGHKSTNEYPIGICDGKLYRVMSDDDVQLSTESGWTHIGGYCSEAGTTGYGICNGKLYAIEYNSVTQIGTESDWMYLSEAGTIAIRGSDSGTGDDEEPGTGSGTTGIILNGLFLSSVKPKIGQKGLLLDNKYFLPFVEGSGSAEYYRCASVDTSTKTWTGYRAVFDGEGYAYETTVTEGLSYTFKTPAVGNTYTADALVEIATLYETASKDGLIFNAPLASQKATDETGKILTYNGTISHTTLDNKQCAYLESNAYISATVPDLPGDAAVPRTIAFCCRFVEKNTNAYFLSLGDSGRLEIYYSWSGPTLWISTANGAITPASGYEDMPVQGDRYLNPDTWYHIAVTYHPALFSDGRNGARVYKNGAYIGSDYKDLTTNGSSVRIGAYGSNYTSKTYISDVMLYNKALSQEEITSLYNRVKSW